MLLTQKGGNERILENTLAHVGLSTQQTAQGRALKSVSNEELYTGLFYKWQALGLILNLTQQAISPRLGIHLPPLGPTHRAIDLALPPIRAARHR